jgi:hypothetical protein
MVTPQSSFVFLFPSSCDIVNGQALISEFDWNYSNAYQDIYACIAPGPGGDGVIRPWAISPVEHTCQLIF